MAILPSGSSSSKIGPYDSYAPPGVYTKTITEILGGSGLTGLRIPLFIGAAQEVVGPVSKEIIRGSSTADILVTGEDVSGRWVVGGTNSSPVLGENDGAVGSFKVKNFPIVNGAGSSTVTNDATLVSVSVDGEPVSALSVDGLNGVVSIPVGSAPFGSHVVVTYYYDRNDTSIVKENVSSQVTANTADLVASYVVISSTTFATAKSLEITLNSTLAKQTVVLNSNQSTLDLVVTAINDKISGLASKITDYSGKDVIKLSTSNYLKVGGDAAPLLGFINSVNVETNRNKEFYVGNWPLVKGDNSPSPATKANVIAYVNDNVVAVEDVVSSTGLVKLSVAPAQGSTVTISYFFNTWQNTYDFLPNINVIGNSAVVSMGTAKKYDASQYVINSSNGQSKIYWGKAFDVAADVNAGGLDFGSSQISGILSDTRVYGEKLEKSGSGWTLANAPTSGNGVDTFASSSSWSIVTNGRYGVSTMNPEFIRVFVGNNLSDAVGRGSVAVKNLTMDGNGKVVVNLLKPVLASQNVYADYFYSRLQTTVNYSVDAILPGSSSSSILGTYSIRNKDTSALVYGVEYVSHTASPAPVWPSGELKEVGGFLLPNYSGGEGTVTVNLALEPAGCASLTSNTNADGFNITSANANFGTLEVGGTAYSTINLNAASSAVVVGAETTFDWSSVQSAWVLNLTVDSTTTPVAVGSATSINDFMALLPNGVTATKVVCNNGKSRLVLKSNTSGATSKVSINNASTQQFLNVLGLAIGTTTGVTNAVNGPASITSNSITTQTTANDSLSIECGSVKATIPITAGLWAEGIAGAINNTSGINNAVTATFSGTGANKTLTITSVLTGKDIKLNLTGSLASKFQQTSAEGTNAKASSIVSVINSNIASLGKGYAVLGTDSFSVVSYDTGTGSSVKILSGIGSVFRSESGLGFNVGDVDYGQAQYNSFTVTSSLFQGTKTGIVGQTFNEASTGLTFTLLASSSGLYAAGGTVTLAVSNVFKVNNVIANHAVPGVELVVSNTVNVASGSTASMKVFAGEAGGPSVGSYYDVSYSYAKSDYSTKVFSNIRDVKMEYGDSTSENPLSLAAFLAFQNGAQYVACKQVPRNSNKQVEPESFIAAIDAARKPIGGAVKPDIIVPLSTDPVVMSYLAGHVNEMSTTRMEGERTAIVGVAAGVSPTGVSSLAKSLKSTLMTVVYPDTFAVTNGKGSSEVVDGSYFAAALAASTCSPAFDVASPWTRRTVSGFTGLGRILEPTEANQVAVSGVTVAEQNGTSIRIRHGLTTNVDNVITRTPSVTLTIHYVQQQLRSALDPFIGVKFTPGVVASVKNSIEAQFDAMIKAQIVGQVSGVTVTVDDVDPTILRTEAIYVPVFPLEYIVTNLSIRVRI